MLAAHYKNTGHHIPATWNNRKLRQDEIFRMPPTVTRPILHVFDLKETFRAWLLSPMSLVKHSGCFISGGWDRHWISLDSPMIPEDQGKLLGTIAGDLTWKFPIGCNSSSAPQPINLVTWVNSDHINFYLQKSHCYSALSAFPGLMGMGCGKWSFLSAQ